MKINANFRSFAGVNFDATKFISSPANGVNRFMLDRVGTEKARATTIVEFQPNSKFPHHTHTGGEEYLVLKGGGNVASSLILILPHIASHVVVITHTTITSYHIHHRDIQR